MKSKYLIIHFSILNFVICLPFLVLFELGLPIPTLIYLECLLLFLLFIWCIFSWKKLTGRFFEPYIIFITAAYLFNGGQTFLELFHLNKYGMLSIYRFPDYTLLKTIYLVILSLACLHFGAILSYSYKKAPKQSINLSIIEAALRRIGWILLGISFMPTLITLKEELHIVFEKGYFGLFERDPEVGIFAWKQILSNFLIVGSIFLLAGSKQRLFSRMFSLFCILSYCILMFFMGWRSKAVLPIVGYLWTWHKLIKPLPTFLCIAASFVVTFILSPVIKAIRNIAGYEHFSLNLLIHLLLDMENPIVLAIYEYGITMRNIAFTLELVPSTRPFDWGLNYVYAVLTIVPNLFWEIHPSQLHHLGSWLTSTVAPLYYAQGGGYGFSFIAEAYLNFGWWGTPILMIIIGYFWAKFSLWSQEAQSPDKIALAASFLSFYLFFVRAESMSIIRPFVWFCLGPYLFLRMCLKFSKTPHFDGL